MQQIEPVYHSLSYFSGDRFVTEHTPLKENKGVFVLLHGFPAWVSKNYDVGEVLAQEGYHVYVPHHEGLGLSRGTFNFLRNIESTRHFLEEVKRRHPHDALSLVGHSWGGYLCLRCLDYITDRLILIAPLAKFPVDDRRVELIENLYTVNEADMQNYTKSSLSDTFNVLEADLNCLLLKTAATAPKTLLLYGDNDEVIPSDLIREFSNSVASERIETAVFPDDHRLSKRRPVLEKIRTWLQSN